MVDLRAVLVEQPAQGRLCKAQFCSYLFARLGQRCRAECSHPRPIRLQALQSYALLDIRHLAAAPDSGVVRLLITSRQHGRWVPESSTLPNRFEPEQPAVKAPVARRALRADLRHVRGPQPGARVSCLRRSLLLLQLPIPSCSLTLCPPFPFLRSKLKKICLTSTSRLMWSLGSWPRKRKP
jgi:hypothetical protein